MLWDPWWGFPHIQRTPWTLWPPHAAPHGPSNSSLCCLGTSGKENNLQAQVSLPEDDNKVTGKKKKKKSSTQTQCCEYPFPPALNFFLTPLPFSETYLCDRDSQLPEFHHTVWLSLHWTRRKGGDLRWSQVHYIDCVFQAQVAPCKRNLPGKQEADSREMKEQRFPLTRTESGWTGFRYWVLAGENRASFFKDPCANVLKELAKCALRL